MLVVRAELEAMVAFQPEQVVSKLSVILAYRLRVVVGCPPAAAVQILESHGLEQRGVRPTVVIEADLSLIHYRGRDGPGPCARDRIEGSGRRVFPLRRNGSRDAVVGNGPRGPRASHGKALVLVHLPVHMEKVGARVIRVRKIESDLLAGGIGVVG